MNRQNIAFLAVIIAIIGGALFYAQESGEADLSEAFGNVTKKVTNLSKVSAYTDAGVVVRADGYEARIHKAIDAISKETISERPAELIGETEGDIWTDAPDLLAGVPDGRAVKSIWDDAEVKAALLASDEKEAVDLLLSKGAKFIVLHSRVAPSADRHKKVLSRLYHHDHLERASLFHVGHGLMYYVLREQPLQFPPQLALASALYLKAKIKGGEVPAFPNVQSELGYWDIVGTIRGQGQELAIAMGRAPTLQGALDEVAADLEVYHRREVELFGFPPLAEHIDDLNIEIHRIYERAYIEPRSEDVLQEMWEMGIDGAFILRDFQGDMQRAVLPGAVAYTRAIRSADRFLRTAASYHKMSERRPWRDPDCHFEVFRTIHYMVTPDGRMDLLYRGVPPAPMSSITLDEAEDIVLRSAEWYNRNMREDGSVTYKMWPSENRYSNEYNIVRHTLATWNLVQAWQLDPRPEYLEQAERALEFTNRYLVEDEENNMAYYDFNNVTKLGTAVVQLLGIIELAKAQQTDKYDELIKKLGRFTLYMQLDSGTFDGYHVPPDHPYYKQKNDIVPGEAALALVYIADYFDDDSWIETLPGYWDYFEPWYYERKKKADPTAPAPWHTYENNTRLDLVQFGPWTVMAADAYYRRTQDEEVADFALDIARWMIETYEWTEENAPFPDYIGGYYKLPGELPAMQAFCYAEGTAAAYSLAMQAGREEERKFFEQHTREAVRFARQMQYDERSAYPFSRDWEVYGGIRYAMNETKVRIDYVHHGLSAVFQYVMAAKRDPNLPEAVKGSPVAQDGKEPDNTASNEATRDEG